MEKKKLTRSSNRVLAGVCGGLAEYFDLDPTLVRVAYAAFSVCGPGLLLYIIMLILMPEQERTE